MLTLKLISEETERVIKGLEKKHFEGAHEAVEKVLEYDKIVSYEEFFKHYKAINNMLVDEVLKGNMKLREIRNKNRSKINICLFRWSSNNYIKRIF